jgi:hypothetical protein
MKILVFAPSAKVVVAKPCLASIILMILVTVKKRR